MFQHRETLSLTVALALALVLIGCHDLSGRARVPGAEARQLVERGATLLDVRTPAEWSSGHLEGATLVPVSELGARMSEVPRDRPVVVYCRSGARSAQAAAMLAAAGYDVHDLGPMSAWSD